MNRIEVIGGRPYQRKYVESITEFCIQTLMPRMKSLDLTIRLTTIKDGSMGYCCQLGTNREFEIEIDRKLTLRKLLETVAHELVHVKQYARKELGPYHNSWMGKTVNPSKVAYWDLPWEIEAHGRELGLFVRWCELHIHRAGWTQLD